MQKSKGGIMKRAFLLLLAVGLVFFGASHAYAQKGSFASLSLGYTMPDDSDIDFDAGLEAEVEYDGGYIISGEIGGWVAENWRASTELLYQKNDLDEGSISVDGDVYQENDLDEMSATGGSISVDGDAEMTALMCNIYYDFDTGSKFKPFLTAGVGGARVEVSDITSPATSPYYLEGDDDYVFAYQAGVGVAYDFDGPFALDVKYRYLATSDPEFEISETEFGSHNFYVGYRYNF
jgi:opacity protein-like surface antigen